MSSIPLYQNNQSLGAAPSFGSAPAVNFSQLFNGAGIANAGQSMRNLGAKITKGEMEKAAHLEDTRATQKYNQGKVAKNLMVSNFKKELVAYIDDPANQSEDMLTGAREILNSYLGNIERTRQGDATDFSGLIDEDAGEASPFEQVNRRYAHMRNKLVDELEQEMTGFFASSGFINAISAREEAYIKGEANNTLEQLEQDQLDEIRANPSFLSKAITKIEDSAEFLPKAEQRERLDQFEQKAVATIREDMLSDIVYSINDLSLNDTTPANVKATFDEIQDLINDHISNVSDISPNERSIVDAKVAAVVGRFVKNTSLIPAGKSTMGQYYAQNLDESLINTLVRHNPDFRSLLGLEKDATKLSEFNSKELSQLSIDSNKLIATATNSRANTDWSDNTRFAHNAVYDKAKVAYEGTEKTDRDLREFNEVATNTAILDTFESLSTGGIPALFKDDYSWFHVTRPKGSSLTDGELWVSANWKDAYTGNWNEDVLQHITSELSINLSKRSDNPELAFIVAQDNMDRFANRMINIINRAKSEYFGDPPGTYGQWLLTKEFDPTTEAGRARNLTKEADANKLKEITDKLDSVSNDITLALNSGEEPDYSALNEPLMEYTRHTRKLNRIYKGYPISSIPHRSARSAVASARSFKQLNEVRSYYEKIGHYGQHMFWTSVNDQASKEDDDKELIKYGSIALARMVGDNMVSMLHEGIKGTRSSEVTDDEREVFDNELGDYGPEIHAALEYYDQWAGERTGVNKANVKAWDQLRDFLIAQEGNGKEAANLIKQSIQSNVRFTADANGKPLALYIKDNPELIQSPFEKIVSAVNPTNLITGGRFSRWNFRMEHNDVVDNAIERELGYAAETSMNFQPAKPYVQGMRFQYTRAEWLPKDYGDLENFTVGGVPITEHDRLKSVLGITTNPNKYKTLNKQYKAYLNALNHNLIWMHDRASNTSTLGMRTKGSGLSNAEVLTIKGQSIQMKTSELAQLTHDLIR